MSNIFSYVSIPSTIEDITVMYPSFRKDTIQIHGRTREYLTANVDINTKKRDLNVLLCFPGGAETPDKFMNYTQFNLIDEPVFVFMGQHSANTTTFQNAFPWLFEETYQNDIAFVDAVLKKHYYNTLIDNIRNGITNLIKEPKQHYLYAIDKYWFRLQQINNWYLITPLTVTQREDYSDIEKRPTNYTRVMTDLSKEWLVNPQPRQNIKMDYTQKPLISLSKINFST